MKRGEVVVTRILNQDERRVIKMLWLMVLKAAERSRRQRRDNFL